MARSTYVYVVMRKGHSVGYQWEDPKPAGMFTVKREAHERTPNREDYYLMRYKDGQLDDGAMIPWDAEIGPQRAAPKSPAAVQAESNQAKSAFDYL